MDKNILKGQWNQIKGKLKEKYGELTDDDVTFTEGKFDEMLGKIQEKTGKSIDDLKKEFGSFFK